METRPGPEAARGGGGGGVDNADGKEANCSLAVQCCAGLGSVAGAARWTGHSYLILKLTRCVCLFLQYACSLPYLPPLLAPGRSIGDLCYNVTCRCNAFRTGHACRLPFPSPAKERGIRGCTLLRRVEELKDDELYWRIVSVGLRISEQSMSHVREGHVTMAALSLTLTCSLFT